MSGVQLERIQVLNREAEQPGRFVLVWMQQAQRVAFNHALTHAVELANLRGLPVAVLVGITDRYPGANRRHYAFMAEGLADVQAGLEKLGIPLWVVAGSPERAVLAAAREAALVVTDCGYTRIQKTWRAKAAVALNCPLIQVESDVVVPLEVASEKREYAAYTLRRKIHRNLPRFMRPVKPLRPKKDGLGLAAPRPMLPVEPEAFLAVLALDDSVSPVAKWRGGERAAQKRLRQFMDEGLADYAERRNDPNADALSGLSPYLHFGQISALQAALWAAERGGDGAQAFLEELVVRRELAMNFVHFTPDYDRYSALPDWARLTLAQHARDPRTHAYSLADWEAGRTHDPYFNAAQLEMVRSGKMHGYMRMYWGKKILEWSRSPERAFEIALYLNDKYELDGRDPNGYTGVAWCFGLHDRAWAERPVFGKIRYMNDKGLRRKFDADAYVRRIATLENETHMR